MPFVCAFIERNNEHDIHDGNCYNKESIVSEYHTVFIADSFPTAYRVPLSNFKGWWHLLLSAALSSH